MDAVNHVALFLFLFITGLTKIALALGFMKIIDRVKTKGRMRMADLSLELGKAVATVGFFSTLAYGFTLYAMGVLAFHGASALLESNPNGEAWMIPLLGVVGLAVIY